MSYSVSIQITAPVYETELTERVAEAITTLFPEAEPEEQHGELRATVQGLDHFSDLLHRQEILDTARSIFFENQRGESFSFRLKKQAALVGRVNFAVENPGELGTISVQVRVDEPDVEQYIDHVAPPTEDGQPIDV